MNYSIPTRVFAGVTIPDTPLITKALDFAKAHSTNFTFNHIYRSFLFGFILGAKVPEFQSRDLEVHAISAILHDLGWDPTGEFVSADKRFEIDGAQAARAFIQKEATNATEWSEDRLQLVWDTIALHSTTTIALYKEPEVAAATRGIWFDFLGPDGDLLTETEYEQVVKELPRYNLGKGSTEIFERFCVTKPNVTFDSIASLWGDKYHVDGYSEKRIAFLDEFEKKTEELDARDRSS